MAIRLNLGAGAEDRQIPGYVNIDQRAGRGAYPLPEYADNSVDEVRASHLLEHFAYAEAPLVLAEWVRVLKPGGYLKIAVPNFGWIVSNLDRTDLPIEGYLMGGQQHEHDFHRSIYDEAKLRRLLTIAGLVEIEPWKSELNDCASYEVSLNLQGRKPSIESAGATLEVKAKVVALGSVPRLGWQAHFGVLWRALNTEEYAIPFWKFGGAFWEQGVTAGLEKALEQNVEWAIVADYDTICVPEDVKELLTLAAMYEEADAIVPWQVRRGGGGRFLFTIADAAGNARARATADEFETDLTPITTGHFGLTLIKTAVLKRMERPWLMSQPNPETGRWDNKRIDADIWFWKQLHKAGGKVFIANNIRVGHIEEEITWVDREFNVFRQTIGDFNEHGKPEGCR